MKVLVADGQWLSRAGLSQVLKSIDPGCRIVEAGTFEEARAAAAKGGFDLCIIDMALPGASPTDCIVQFRAVAPAVPVAVLSLCDGRRDALRALELGVQGYVLKSAGAEDIRHGIERVLAGEISLPANLRDTPEAGPSGLTEGEMPTWNSEARPMESLTYRQREVLALIATGKRNAEIGKALDISPRTVQIHVSTILKLLGVGNRTEAALMARRWGFGD